MRMRNSAIVIISILSSYIAGTVQSTAAAEIKLTMKGAPKSNLERTVVLTEDSDDYGFTAREPLSPSIDLLQKLDMFKDNHKVILNLHFDDIDDKTDYSAVIYRYDANDSLVPCSEAFFPPDNLKLEIKVDLLRCTSDEQFKDNRKKGGMLAIRQADTVQPVARLEFDTKVPIQAGDDIGVALNILNRSSDGMGFRFFEGASVYYSVSNLKSESMRVIVNLSALDFDPDLDFETGLALGLLYKPAITTRNKTGNGFALSVTYGYNFMVDDSDDGWYTIIGFGWNFNKASQ